MFPGIPQAKNDVLSEAIHIWKGQFWGHDTRRKPVTFFSLNAFDSKTSLVLLPLLASAGLIVPKIIWSSQAEGKSLASNLSTIPGMKLRLNINEMRSMLEFSGGVFVYAPESLRIFLGDLDSSATSAWHRFSLLCLLTLNGLDAKSAVYDIKINDSLPDFDIRNAREAAIALKLHSERLGIKSSFFLNYMHQPLGQALGPVLELIEALEILKGRGPHDVKKLVLEQGTDLLMLAKNWTNRNEAKATLKSLILRGHALNKMEEIIQAQHGNFRIVNDYSELPKAGQKIAILSSETGFVARMRIFRLLSLKASLMSIHPGAGLILHKNAGDTLKKGDLLADLHFPAPRCPLRLQEEIRSTFVVTEHPPVFLPLIAEKIR